MNPMHIIRETLDNAPGTTQCSDRHARDMASCMSKKLPLGTALVMSLMLSGCSGMSGGDGFPDPNDAYMQGGTLETSRAIQTVQPGMTKDQVRDLLGNPHFSEGLINVRTWDYLFDLSDHGSPGSMMCQFQLTFDGAMRVEEMRWRTAKCATRYSTIQVEPIESAGMAQHYHLPVVGTFAEDGALTNDGRQVLEEFVQVLQRDFLDPTLAIGSYPEPGRYRAQRQAVQRFLKARGGVSADKVSLTSETLPPCRGINSGDACRGGQVVIGIRER